MDAPRADATSGSGTGATGTANMTASAASGLSWSVLSIAALVVANLAYTATVSRLLDPADFGLVAMANLVVLFGQYFARMGLASALVQKPELTDEEIRAASTAGFVIGVVCFGLVWLLAPAVAVLFHTPEVTPVLRGLGASFLFMGWSMTGLGLLRRELRFRALSVISVGGYVVGYLVVGIGLALLGAGVWSLVAAIVASTLIQAVWQFALRPHPLRPVLGWRHYRAVCGYGTRLSIAHVLDYIGSNLDTFTVARIASTATLGQYSRAYYLVFQPLGNYMSAALTNVVFTTLSRVQGNVERLRRGYLSVMSLGALLVFPLSAGMAVAAPELIEAVLGPQWGAAVGLVPWFALAGACHVASQLSQSLAEARAELNRSVAVQVGYLVVLAALIVLALQFTSREVWLISAAVAVAELLRYLGYLVLARSVLDLRAAQVSQAHVPAIFAGVGVALAVAAARWVLTGAPVLAVLAAEIAVGAIALVLCIRVCPATAVRAELWFRLESADLLGPPDGRRRRVASLVVGPPDRAVSEVQR
ncbi:lipopolysaccharide biosynthesis protein [Actinomycetospora sp. NBRC 106375]|uniref:lipopolysaccharide biosynthesis protein n=1 Tax=Actinomycetospora sp. NBRC 106375 TaxID=3032207 RepID=UPI0024A00053|nr:lipopolysaccharide biosynthesis protein [Actinomycetospora sp. NBRC 106375]GLZ46962.1 lipopolysaccharide biosynthesis protein [Actinomycetospora sp. NBRC 106375]